MQQKPHNGYSNRIEDNLNGSYNFDVKYVLLQGWKNTLASFGLFFQMMLLIFLIGSLIAAIYLKVEGIEQVEQITLDLITAFDLIIRILLAPLVASLMMQGAKAHVKQSGKVLDVFSFMSQTLPICVVTIFTLVLTMVGINLLILPGIYIMIATGFAVMLVADKNLTPFASIWLSIRMVNKYFVGFLLVNLVFFGLLLLTAFTYGLGLVLLVPFYFNVKGVLYCELFGYQSTLEDTQPVASNESKFDA
ncbi:hypothetical protein [Aliiglaciecola sp. LCG003]|uniref:hypothetical protein n=1 Tax=Aliiglaciecola sp. LCG003 TaxID=3053655 RepID=UPI0025739BC0|nr:hypothetical protein [Aliiglaciecola sp. LCG003]WJG07595.1 hypothetical protein QR722_09455 [Aliiglaciecola sp. LCG003]